jgi:hypothetical protein
MQSVFFERLMLQAKPNQIFSLFPKGYNSVKIHVMGGPKAILTGPFYKHALYSV